ncbi:multidrug transporter [Pleurocapsales cyanobacterium LEGE 10410]|nr:multidrug transporter [Pleurocapsales cyanobacterium LEGE 10410]
MPIKSNRNSFNIKVNQIVLNPSSIACILGAGAFLLVLASIGGQLTAYLTEYDHIYVRKLIWYLYVDAERNIPTGFSTLLLLFAALLLAIITILEKQNNFPTLHWASLSCGFLLMAADEAWSFHEKLIQPVRELLGDDNLGIFYFAWVIPGIALLTILAPFFLRFLRCLPAKIRFSFMTAATLYIGGAIGVELFGGRFAELHGTLNLTYSMFTTVEESLEMGGAIMFIWTLLTYIAINYKEVQFQFKGVRGSNSRRSLRL